MKLLTQFKQDLGSAIADYESSRRDIRPNRAVDLAEITTTIKEAVSPVALRQYLTQKITQMKTGSISFIGWLDLNALRVRLNRVLSQDQYGLINLLISENTEDRLYKAKLEQEIDSLHRQLYECVAGQPERLQQLDTRIAQLSEQLQQKSEACEQLQQENDLLASCVTKIRHECDGFRHRAESAEAKLERLHHKLMSTLQENQRLRDGVASGVVPLRELSPA